MKSITGTLAAVAVTLMASACGGSRSAAHAPTSARSTCVTSPICRPGRAPQPARRSCMTRPSILNGSTGLSSSSSIVSVEDTGHDITLDQPRLVVEKLLELLP